MFLEFLRRSETVSQEKSGSIRRESYDLTLTIKKNKIFSYDTKFLLLKTKVMSHCVLSKEVALHWHTKAQI